MPSLVGRNAVIDMLFFVILWGIICQTSEGGLMGKTGGLLGRYQGKNNQKPWDANRSNYWMNNYDEDNGENDGDSDQHKKRPCVGLCYAKKMKALERGEDITNMNFHERRPRKKPCLGLCHYYRTLGKPNPFEDEENQPRKKPCIGLCHYYRTHKIPNPYDTTERPILEMQRDASEHSM